ncbi:MAG: PIN domain-containing protein [Acidiphilium sp.]
MIILDTNVVSEPLKPAASEAVIAWLDRQDPSSLYLTAITLAELLLGLELLPLGRRRSDLEARIGSLLNEFLPDRILPFDPMAARFHAPLSARARDAGRAISLADGQIAAIAAMRGYAVATRDTAPFIAAGVAVIDPWTA